MSRSSQHIEQGCLNLNICQIPKTAAAWRKRKHEPYLCRDRFIPWWVFQKLAANARIYVRRSRMQGGGLVLVAPQIFFFNSFPRALVCKLSRVDTTEPNLLVLRHADWHASSSMYRVGI